MITDPRLTPARPDLAARHLQGRVSAARFVDGEDMHVASPVLDLFRSTDPGASLASQLLSGENFTVYEIRTDGLAWGQASLDGYVGYVDAGGLARGSLTPTSRITALSTHIYKHPSLKSRAQGWLPFNAMLPVTATRDEFTAISDDQYCPSAHLGPENVLADDFVTVAERFAGAPYLWGGRTVRGIDCSGLVQIALHGAGIRAPRDSDIQAVLGESIGKNVPLKRGDLILWKGHIGIMHDPQTLLHANAHAMAVSFEPLCQVEARIDAGGYGPITGRRRL